MTINKYPEHPDDLVEGQYYDFECHYTDGIISYNRGKFLRMGISDGVLWLWFEFDDLEGEPYECPYDWCFETIKLVDHDN